MAKNWLKLEVRMSNHVLRPILIGLFVLVVIVTAVIFVYSSAPQASEIAPSTGSAAATNSPRATSTAATYTAPKSGTVECSDGVDNDNDGLSDWGDPELGADFDTECDSSRDRSERYIGEQ